MRKLRAKLLRTALIAIPAMAFELAGGSGAQASESSASAATTNAAATTATTNADTATSTSASADTDTDAGAITSSTNETLELAVVLNNHPTGQIGEFQIRAGRLFASRDELQSLGFQVPDSIAATGDLVPLVGSPGLAIRIDQASQTVYVSADGQWLRPTILGPSSPAATYVIESSPGATLNYDLIGASTDGHTAASGALDFRAFSRFGVLTSGLIFHTGRNLAGSGDGLDVVRLDTTYVYSDPKSLRRYRLGDFISGGLSWTRPVRMAGLQVNLDFSMRPDLITFPLPAISGSAAVPSTVDVLVNNSQVVSGEVPPGPFEVPHLPVINGGGTITTTITDALGRQQVTEVPFYASPLLLAPGLQSYSAEIGFIRRNWGSLSNDYGSAAGSLTYRRGLSQYLTVETHGEATKGVAVAGIGGAANLFNFAVANLAVAASIHSGHTGGQIAAGLEHVASPFSFGASVIAADRHFADIAAVNGAPVATLLLNAHGGLSLPGFGSFGLAYTQIDRAAQQVLPGGPFDPSLTPLLAQPQHSKLFTASYSKQIGPALLYANAFHDFAGEKKETTVTIGLSFRLGHLTSASISAQSGSNERSAQADIQRSAAEPGDWGYRAFASANRLKSWSDHEFAQATYKAQWGQLFLGADRTNSVTTVQGEVRGAISLIDDAIFASNNVYDSFAVVDTGVPGIRIRRENREVGRTDSHGRLLVTDLRAFEPNHLSIEPLDAPADAEVSFTKREVRPLDHSGVVVSIPIRITHGALLAMLDMSGKPLPVGSTATLKSTGAAVPVGYDGEAYLVDLQQRNEVEVEKPDGRICTVQFNYKPAAGDIPTIGPLRCQGAIQ